MKKIVVLMSLLLVVFCAFSQQDAGQTMKPNFRKIARVTRNASSPYYAGTLAMRFQSCDTSLSVDDMRCLYFGGNGLSLSDSFQQYLLLSGRWGRQSRQANDAWTRYQLLTTAVWSTGNGTKRKPLYVMSKEDAEQIALGYDDVLWFKMKGKKKFSVVPQR